VSGCTGSSQHSRLSAPADPGLYNQTGQQNVPIGASSVVRLPDITVTKHIDRDGDGTFEDLANPGEYSFSLDGGTPVTTGYRRERLLLQRDPDGSHVITEAQVDFSLGTYQFIEGSGTNCVFSGSTATASVRAGDLNSVQNASCSFYNRIGGKIIVDKVTNPAHHTQLFDFDASWLPDGDGNPATFDTDFQLADDTAPYASGWLLPGSYSVAEVAPSGWSQSAALCSGGDGDDTSPSSIVLESGEVITCVFTNTEWRPLTVSKTVSGSYDRTLSWSLSKSVLPVSQSVAAGRRLISTGRCGDAGVGCGSRPGR